MEILSNAINETLKNVQKRLVQNSNILVKIFEQKRLNKIKKLELELSSIEKQIRSKDLLKKKLLREKLSLAKELNIVNNPITKRM